MLFRLVKNTIIWKLSYRDKQPTLGLFAK